MKDLSLEMRIICGRYFELTCRLPPATARNSKYFVLLKEGFSVKMFYPIDQSEFGIESPAMASLSMSIPFTIVILPLKRTVE